MSIKKIKLKSKVEPVVQKRRVGRPRSFEEPEDMFAVFLEYEADIKKNPFLVHDYKGKDVESVMIKKQRPLTMEGFQNHCWRTEICKDIEDYFYNKDGRYEKFTGVCNLIKKLIRQNQIEGGAAGIFNASITQRLNNLVEKSEVVEKIIEKKQVFEINGTIIEF
jgi:hypothetical protein